MQGNPSNRCGENSWRRVPTLCTYRCQNTCHYSKYVACHGLAHRLTCTHPLGTLRAINVTAFNRKEPNTKICRKAVLVTIKRGKGCSRREQWGTREGLSTFKVNSQFKYRNREFEKGASGSATQSWVFVASFSTFHNYFTRIHFQFLYCSPSRTNEQARGFGETGARASHAAAMGAV